ncbi:MAG: NPP1 family protein [Caldilineaceae bacterium]|nr:NPP1 family protein [Caldilineaceae bacterium]
MNEEDLLRRYEPVARYTDGEMFFPCAVDEYLVRCHLWLADAERKTTLLARPGEVTADTLGDYATAPRNHRLFLQFVDAPLNPVEYQRWRSRPDRPVLHAPSRLQRIGLFTRIVDGLFDLSLLVRGRVPGGTAAAAQIKYTAMRAEDSRRVYYGRAVREGGYIILHYLYFFPMNDWRSTFHGANDHESDWEQVMIYLSDEGEAEPIPRWVAFASHDFSGDDLRRRWDDPELQKVNETHPVLFVGAGSHASYFAPGEYMMNVEPGFLRPLHATGAAVDRVWADVLRQGTSLNLEHGLESLLSIPFVDYARGDGLSIGPDQDESWSLILISDADGWVDDYRGLWGLDTWDPLGGERAPAGPKYDRTGSVRLAWRDPLAWAGLDTVAPPNRAVHAMTLLLSELEARQDGLVKEIASQRRAVRQLELEIESLRSTQFLNDLLVRREAEMTEEEAELTALSKQLNEIYETRKAGQRKLEHLAQGDFGPPRAHIRRAHAPAPPIRAPSHFGRLWAAASGGLILLAIFALVYLHPPSWPLWIAAIAVFFGGVDAATRGRVTPFLLRLTMLLALITALILLSVFWPQVIALSLIILVGIMIRDNIQEVFDR